MNVRRLKAIWLAGWMSLIVGFALLASPSVPSLAQSNDSLSGIVRDEQGPVAGAIVRVRATNQSAVTDAEGRFTLTGLMPGEPVNLTAWASGYYIVGGEEYLPGTDDVELVLVAHAEQDDSSYQWLSAYASAGEAGNCQNCHADPDDPSATLPFDEWTLDGHAHSAVNPRFLTMYTGTDMAGNQSPPTRYGYARDYGRFPLPPDSSQLYYGPGYKLDFPATAGNCAACHAPMAAVDAPYSVDPTQVTGVAAEGIGCDFCHKVWGVHLNPLSGLPYANMPGVLSLEFRRPPEVHQFFAGPLDDVGFAGSEDTYSPLQTQSQFCAACHYGVFWDTPIYNSFGEWLDSPYSDPETGQVCQDCHMPSLGAEHFAAHSQAMQREPDTIFSHQMPGALDETLLQNTVGLDLNAERDEGVIQVQVRLTNTGAGHDVPTNSPLRQMLLVVRAADAQGVALTAIEGARLPAWTGDLAGQPGVYYAKILQDIWTEVSPSGAYWMPTRIVEDTRLPALEADANSYIFAAPGEGAVTVEARVIFRRAFYDLMQQKGWDVPDILMEAAQVMLP